MYEHQHCAQNTEQGLEHVDAGDHLGPQELEFIHRSCSVVGYRPNVFSTTLSHLVATNCAALIIPFIALREKVKEAVEEHFSCEFELFTEFTGLISISEGEVGGCSWTEGASIGWHSDNNRNYLRQRQFSAVCYLNTFEKDFHGGLFHFQDGEPSTVVPAMGNVLIYSANEENVHCVDEVTEGERLTMALWFTRDQMHDEDSKLIQKMVGALRHIPCSLTWDSWGLHSGDKDTTAEPCTRVSGDCSEYISTLPTDFLPLAASTNMYWVSAKYGDWEGLLEFEHKSTRDLSEGERNHEKLSGFDVRVARLASTGLYVTPDIGQGSGHSKIGDTEEIDDVLNRPLKLSSGRKELPFTFANSLHALQVAIFYQWRNEDMGHETLLSSKHAFDIALVQEAEDDKSRKFKRQRISSGRTVEVPKEDSTLNCASLSDAKNCQQKFDRSLDTLTVADSIFQNNLNGSTPNPDNGVLFVSDACLHEMSGYALVAKMVKPWESYIGSLWKDLLESLPSWKACGTLSVNH